VFEAGSIHAWMTTTPKIYICTKNSYKNYWQWNWRS